MEGLYVKVEVQVNYIDGRQEILVAITEHLSMPDRTSEILGF